MDQPLALKCTVCNLTGSQEEMHITFQCNAGSIRTTSMHWSAFISHTQLAEAAPCGEGVHPP